MSKEILNFKKTFRALVETNPTFSGFFWWKSNQILSSSSGISHNWCKDSFKSTHQNENESWCSFVRKMGYDFQRLFCRKIIWMALLQNQGKKLMHPRVSFINYNFEMVKCCRSWRVFFASNLICYFCWVLHIQFFFTSYPSTFLLFDLI